MNINPKSINDMSMMNIKSQAQLVAILQKVGKGKRKKEIILNKGSQKYLEQLVGEMKKQMVSMSKQFPNVFDFFNYLEKNLKVEKRFKRPKQKSLMISFEEYDFLIKQMKDIVKGLQGEISKLKWYNLIKKRLYKIMIKHTEALLDNIKK